MSTNGRQWHLFGSELTPLDTSMALLFLKRANLTQDLTRTIRLQMAITDPDAGAGPGNKK